MNRRALTHVGGPTRTFGDVGRSRKLADALDVQSALDDEGAAREHLHGFHTYPAKLHPVTARRLVEAISQAGDTVLDPFCGSGTVLLEARILGRRVVGVDANPLAVRLARRKATPTDHAYRKQLIEAATRARAVADERRKKRTGASHRYGAPDVALFDPHVLLELDGLRLGIDAIEDRLVRADIELVLSSILIKFSRKSSDTDDVEKKRRIAAGLPSKWLVKKTEELCGALAQVEPALSGRGVAKVLAGDARVLEGIADGSVQAIVTSPPYAGVYDYLEHHRARLRWLRMKSEDFQRRELGARRNLHDDSDDALVTFRGELKDFFKAARRVLSPGGRMALVIADSVAGGHAFYCKDELPKIATTAGLTVTARVSQERPNFHGPSAAIFKKRARSEHVFDFERTSGDALPSKEGGASGHEDDGGYDVRDRSGGLRGQPGSGGTKTGGHVSKNRRSRMR